MTAKKIVCCFTVGLKKHQTIDKWQARGKETQQENLI